MFSNDFQRGSSTTSVVISALDLRFSSIFKLVLIFLLDFVTLRIQRRVYLCPRELLGVGESQPRSGEGLIQQLRLGEIVSSFQVIQVFILNRACPKRPGSAEGFCLFTILSRSIRGR